MGEKEWLRDVTVYQAYGDTAWYVLYETEATYMRLTHRGTWSRDDMDIYWKSQAEAFAALHVAPCPMEDPSARIAALESTERELREAVRVLGNRIRVGSELHEFMRTEYSHRDKDRKVMNRKRARMKTAFFLACDEVDANPIAAAAVREAGR